MAENEILDVGSPRRYKKWRSALCDPSLSPDEIADFLQEEFVSIIRKTLQGTPLHLILQACGNDRSALQAAIDSCKNRDLAWHAEQAFRATGTRDISVLANYIAAALIDKVQDRARLYTINNLEGFNLEKYRALESASVAKLNACRPDIEKMISASLNNERLPRRSVLSNNNQSPHKLADQSLLVPVHKWESGRMDLA